MGFYCQKIHILLYFCAHANHPLHLALNSLLCRQTIFPGSPGGPQHFDNPLIWQEKTQSL